MLPRPVMVGLIILIALAWATNLVVGFLYPGRSDPAVNAIFAVVASAVVALGRGGGPTKTVRRKLSQLIEPERGPDDRGEQP
jgi:hypothetical protein